MISRNSEELGQGVQHLQIDAERAGQRIDNFLISVLKGVPKSLVYRLLRTGQVRINKGRAKPDYRLKAGDDIRVPPVQIRRSPPVSAAQAEQRVRPLLDTILFENPDFMVLNKPSGLAVHAGSGLDFGLIELLRASHPRYAGIELVHRLDRATSGCLILAKNRSTLLRLHELLQTHAMEKTYVALVKGVLPKAGLSVNTALAKNRLRGGQRVVAVDAQGKAAYTNITTLEQYTGASLASIHIKTGRTHQIRVHCASINHPLAGDDKYGDREFDREMKQLGLKRLFLHASELRFTLDTTHIINAPLPADLQAVLNRLKIQIEKQ